MFNFFWVLGIVPGTDFQLTFNEILLAYIIIALACGLTSYRRLLKAQPTPLHARPAHEQLLLSHPSGFNPVSVARHFSWVKWIDHTN